MGQKVNPIALRIGVHHDFKSIGFYPKKYYRETVLEDIKIRKYLFDTLKHAGIGDVVIERALGKIKIIVFVVRPGVVIGRGGSGHEQLKESILKLIREGKDEKNVPKIDLQIEPIKEPNLNAYLVASTIADQLAKRVSYKRAVKQAADKVMAGGAKGVRIVLSGRIAGAEIGRRERFQTGKVSLSTIRENIDFASVPALTRSGYVGVKVWINRK
jgi:small subunit ribosomal protein S3